MIVGIDIRILSNNEHTGIQEYACQLLQRILPQNPQTHFKLFFNHSTKNSLEYSWAKLPNVEIFNLHIPNKILNPTWQFLAFPKIEQLIGPVDKFFSPHILHIQHQKTCERIMTFHDLSFVKHPYFYSRNRNLWHFIMQPKKQAHTVDKIIAISESTKQDLMNLYHVPENKIQVIYSGINQDFLTQITEKDQQRVRKKYLLPDKYILFFGTLEPRKNILSLLQAFIKSKLSGSLKHKNLKLVIAGNKGWLYSDIFQIVQKYQMQSEVFFTGFIDNPDRSALYSMAEMFVYPSFYEGFGLPPLEAMAQKIPVITSNISSIPEIVQNSAILINPYNPNELKQALESLANNYLLKQELIKRGEQCVQQFNWQQCATQTFDYIIK